MKTIVEINWNHPEEQQWLCPENIQTALSAYCPNTTFEVKHCNLNDTELKDASVKILAEHGCKCTTDELLEHIDDPDTLLSLRFCLEAIEEALKNQK